MCVKIEDPASCQHSAAFTLEGLLEVSEIMEPEMESEPERVPEPVAWR